MTYMQLGNLNVLVLFIHSFFILASDDVKVSLRRPSFKLGSLCFTVTNRL